MKLLFIIKKIKFSKKYFRDYKFLPPFNKMLTQSARIVASVSITGFILLFTTALFTESPFERYPSSQVFDLTLTQHQIKNAGGQYYVIDHYIFNPLPLMECDYFDRTSGPWKTPPEPEKESQVHLNTFCQEVLPNTFNILLIISYFLLSVFAISALILLKLDREYLLTILFTSFILFTLTSFLLFLGYFGGESPLILPRYLLSNCEDLGTEIILMEDWKYCHSTTTPCNGNKTYLSNCFQTYEEAFNENVNTICYIDSTCDIKGYVESIRKQDILRISCFPIVIAIWFISIFSTKERKYQNVKDQEIQLKSIEIQNE